MALYRDLLDNVQTEECNTQHENLSIKNLKMIKNLTSVRAKLLKIL